MDFTIETSWAETTLLTPCTSKVHSLALSVSSEWKPRAIHLLHYLANPIDALIQAVAMPIFTIIDHCRDLGHGSRGEIALKVTCTPLTLAVKLVGAVFVSAGFLFNGASQVIIPYPMIFSLFQGKAAAHIFFYQLQRMRVDQETSTLKPLEILQPQYNDDTNPLCKESRILETQVASYFRKFDIYNGVFVTPEEVLQERERELKATTEHGSKVIELAQYCRSNDFDKSSEKYIDLTTRIEEADNIRKAAKAKCEEFEKQKNEAVEAWSKIRQLTGFGGYDCVLNYGRPWFTYGDW